MSLPWKKLHFLLCVQIFWQNIGSVHIIFAEHSIGMMYRTTEVSSYVIFIVSPHAQRDRGKVIDLGVHIYIYIMSVVEKKIWIVL